MTDFQQKYLEEKRKCDNLLKMQTSIFNDIDEYSKSIVKIRNCVKVSNGQEEEQGQQLTTEMAAEYADQVIAYIRKLGKPCECNRWKGLYQRQSQQTLKLNRYTEQLLEKIKEKQGQQSRDRIEIGQLLNDYLDLFKKQFDVIKQQKEVEKKKERKQQSRSKSKNKLASQTQRKNIKNTNIYEIGSKQQGYIKLIVEKLQKDLDSMHKEVQNLRDKNMELQQVLRIYRQKERKHLLQGSCKWFQ